MNKTVLVIDDDDILRNTLISGLRNEGFYVLSSESAEQATKILSRISVNAIILDRMMTGMDGLSFLQKLRAQGDKTPVIMLTAMTGADNTITGLSNGANDYLAKPFQFRELVLRLNNILEHAPKTELTPPPGMNIINGNIFITDTHNDKQTLLNLSGEEKKLLTQLITPVGNIASAAPMVAKRLRMKINLVSSSLDIITIRGQGYKLLVRTDQPESKQI